MKDESVYTIYVKHPEPLPYTLGSEDKYFSLRISEIEETGHMLNYKA